MIPLLSIGAFLLVFAAVAVLAFGVVRSVRAGTSSGAAAVLLCLFCATALVLLLMRPHEHVYQGLDSSAYRLMEHAFAAGQPMKDVDRTLLEVPAEHRPWLMLLAETRERTTRDRSFEVMSLDGCETQPFFYPILPLCMYGLDLLVPVAAADAFVPLLGSVLAVTMLLVGLYRGGWAGVLLALALLLGSPLPVWLLRGCYAESVSGVLLALFVMSRAFSSREEDGQGFVRGLALGLAVTFHPVMLVIALPLTGVMLMSCATLRSAVARVAGLIMGGLPLVLLTVFVAQPYGTFSVPSIANMIRVSAAIRSTFVAGVSMVVVISVVWMFRVRLRGLLAAWSGGWRSLCLLAALAVLGGLPTLLAVRFWSEGRLVMAGLSELWDGLRWPFGVWLGLCCVWTLVVGRSLRTRAALVIVGMTLPVFLYLKGAESMGLWSQRRLIAPLLIVLVAALPAVCTSLNAWLLSGRPKLIRAMVVLVGLALAGGWNVHHWPAPYGVRYEQGADRWVDEMAARIGPRFAFFDNYGLAVPLASRPGCRAIGLSDTGFKGYGGLADWLGEKAATDEVVVVTAYRSPGMEQGVRLVQEADSHVKLKRARSKTSLPAIKETLDFKAGFLRAEPVVAGHLPMMDKVFDPGPLGLRPPWGRSDIPVSVVGEAKRPARWSREGSGIVGPVPEPGGTVLVHLEAAAARGDGRGTQQLLIQPPWGGPSLEITISNGFTIAEGTLFRPVGDDPVRALTGVYRIHSAYPYDPAKEGIRKFDADLGALIHRMRIEVSTPH